MFIKWTYPEYFSLLRNGAWGCFEELACEQALLFGWASRERLSEGLPLAASPLARVFSQDPLRDTPNRRACSQAIEEQKSYLDHLSRFWLFDWHLPPWTFSWKGYPAIYSPHLISYLKLFQNQNSLAIISLICSYDFMLISSYAWTMWSSLLQCDQCLNFVAIT